MNTVLAKLIKDLEAKIEFYSVERGKALEDANRERYEYFNSLFREAKQELRTIFQNM